MKALSSHRLPALLGWTTLTLVLLALIASLWGRGQGSEERRGKLRLRFVDSGTGQVTPVRVEVLDQEDQAFVAEDALLVEGDSVDQAVRWEGTVEDALARLRPSWRNFDKGTTQFYSGGESLLQLPSGQYRVTARKGIEYREVSRDVVIAAGSHSELTLEIPRWINMPEKGWYSADPHMGIQAGAQNGLSIDLPLNLISFLEVLQFNGADFNVWYSILNTGFEVSPTAGSDYPFGGAPIGRERFYTRVEGTLTYRKWLDGIEQGRTFVSNGPLLEFTVNGRGLGEEVVLTQTGTVRIEGSVRFNPDRDEVEKMEVVDHWLN